MAASAPGALVQVNDVRVRLGDRDVLCGIDLEIFPGEVLVLVGPNGAGKSTLLSVLSGDRKPDAGSVHFGGIPLTSLSHAKQARLRAVLLQEQHVSFPFTVRQVVEMGRAPWAGTSAEAQDEEVVERALDATEVTHLSSQRFPTLSGGEKARTAFARTLAQGTALQFLDEPTAALDIRHQEAVLTRVRKNARNGMAIVIVLHDLSLAAAYADRVAVLSDGIVKAAGPVREVMTAELLSDVYGHPIDVIERPGQASPVIIPNREAEAVL
ncbi:heme ABC transporter ATP-binding protein [Rarobacter faecitabidus]|uniref:Iron complex transport system ATP-binding protein n=1 Tax=Rarobacter faecitabidus TaxID=13243 RepID=A0A542ZX76_RARFA|nr:heme ABC transporter ATP-binding protein [Rarobacter faecitabidus]TQL64952.1 iron complex transport system ATP-binding protein [Rarobacter faecitabidus]